MIGLQPRNIVTLFHQVKASKTSLMLAVLAALFYLTGVGWGLPQANHPFRTHGWATDAITPLGPLAELHNTLVEPKPDQLLSYPMLHYLVLAIAQAPYLIFTWINGNLVSPSPVYPFGFSDPVNALRWLELLGQLVSVLMASGIVVATYNTVKTLWGHIAGMLAGFLTMCLYPMVYYSRTANLDVPVLFWTSLGLFIFAKILNNGLTIQRAIWLGIFAACSAGTKDQGGAAFALLPLALLGLQFWRSRRDDLPFTWKPLLAGVLSFLLAYSIASGFVLSPRRYFAHLAWIARHSELPAQEHFPPTLAGYAGLTVNVLENISDSAGPLMLLAAAGSVFYAARREPRLLLLLLPALGHFMIVLVPLRLSLMRYALPITLIVTYFGAAGLAKLWSSPGTWKWLAGFLNVGMAGYLLLAGADLTYQMWNDSHHTATEWMASNSKSGDLVGSVVSYANLPELETGVNYTLIPPGENLDERIEKSRVDYLIVMPDWTSPKGSPYPASFPADTFHSLMDGSLGYRLAAQFETPAIFPWERKPTLDYPTVNPPIYIFTPVKEHENASDQ